MEGFQIKGGGDGLDALGLWHVQPAGPVSFSTDGTEEEQPLIWSVELPEDLDAAWAMMNAQTDALDATERSIEGVEERFQMLTPPGEGVSFGVEEAFVALEPHDQVLLESMAYLQQRDAAEEVSFGFGLPSLPAGWRETVDEYRDFLSRINKVMRPTLRIDTAVGGELFGITQVGIDGDIEAAWLEGVTRQQKMLHRQAVLSSLRTRRALVQLLAQAGGGAAVLAAKFALPGGAIVALPAAFRYIRDVIAQAQELLEADRSGRRVGGRT